MSDDQNSTILICQHTKPDIFRALGSSSATGWLSGIWEGSHWPDPPPPTQSSLDTSGLLPQPKLVVDMGQVSDAPLPPTSVDDHDVDSRGGRYTRTSQFVSLILTLVGLGYFTTDVEMVKDISK